MESGLKQRLVGAAVLVALAVIFLPMLVKGPAPDSGVSDLSLRVPDAPSGDYRTVDLPLVVNGDSAATDAPAPADPLPAPAAADDGDALPTVDTATERSAPAASEALPAPEAARSQPMLPASVASGNYAVHFAAFATRDQADAIVRQLRTAELPAFSEPFTLNAKPAFRVRIGPYANRAQAETVRLRAAQIRNDVTPRVLALDADAASPKTVAAAPTPAKPTEPAPQPAKPEPTKPVAATPVAPRPAEATAPAASDTGFVVQLGAFSKAGDADALRDRLRAAGIAAFTDTVNTDKGRLTRVKAGPVLTRADAEKLKGRVKSAVAIDGMIRSHP